MGLMLGRVTRSRSRRVVSVMNAPFRISDFGFRISDFGFRISDFGFRISCFVFGPCHPTAPHPIKRRLSVIFPKEIVMKLHEYQAKALLAAAGAAVPKGIVASTPVETQQAFDRMGGQV